MDRIYDIERAYQAMSNPNPVPLDPANRRPAKPGEKRALGRGKNQRARAEGRPIPLKPADFEALCRSHAAEAVEALVKALSKTHERVSAARVLLDRAYGQATARTEVTGADGGAILMQMTDQRPRPEEFLREWAARIADRPMQEGELVAIEADKPAEIVIEETGKRE